MNYSVIIPNFNGGKFIKECLDHLTAAIKKVPHSKFEIIIVDNGSTDNSLDIAKLYKDIKIINLDKNYGFAAAVNRGIEKSAYEYVCLLNNDLNLDPFWFSLIDKEISNHPDMAAFSGTVLNKQGSHLESQGLEFNYAGKCENIRNGQVFDKSILKAEPSLIWGCSAAVAVYQKQIIQKIGLFDEDFFAYEEDVDLSLRLHNLGYKTMLIPAAISYHLGGGTSAKMGNFRNIHDAKNWIFIIIKNYSLKEIIDNFGGIVEERLRNLSGLVKGTIKSSGLKSVYQAPWAVLKTYAKVFFKLPAMINKRQKIRTLLK